MATTAPAQPAASFDTPTEDSVDPSGSVVRLTSFDLPEVDQERAARRRKLDEDAAAQAAAAPASSEPAAGSGEPETGSNPEDSKPQAAPELVAAVGEEEAGRFAAWATKPGAKSDPFIFSASADKAKRGALHNVIKAQYPGVVTDTVDPPGAAAGEKAKCVRARVGVVDKRAGGSFGPGAGVGQKRGREQEAGPRWANGEHVTFALYKENRDTMDAIGLLCRLLQVTPKTFSYAGTKDKRAVTTQRVSAFKVAPERLRGLNKTLRGMRLGSFGYAREAIRLGDLSGNRFSLVLRDVDADEGQLEAALRAVAERGFLNYYGLQRFGSTGTHKVGAHILRGEWQAAVDAILSPRPGESTEAARAREHFAKTKDIEGALRKMPRGMLVERCGPAAPRRTRGKEAPGATEAGVSLLAGFKRNGLSDPLAALGAVPRNMRTMYVHAYQSLIWNHMASLRVQMCPGGALEGDLVFADARAEAPTPAEEDAVAADAEEAEAAAAVAGAEEGGEGDGAAGAGRAGGGRRAVRALSAEEAASGRYGLSDVLLPLPGFDVQYPSHALKDRYREAMAADGIDIDGLNLKQKEYALPGGYRPLVVKPRDFRWRIARYAAVEEPLLRTDLDVVESRNQHIPDLDDPRAPLGPVPHLAPSAGPLAAVAVGFTLPSSAYATMCLREMMKAPTDLAAQRALNAAAEARSAAASGAAGPEASDEAEKAAEGGEVN
eukprot:tig00020943_g16287.t1